MRPEPNPPRIAVGWLEATLAVAGGAFGMAALIQADAYSFENAVKVAGIPVATAIASGMLFRIHEDRKLPAKGWLALVLPAIHIALIAAVAAMASAHFTGIEKSDDIYPALIWSNIQMLAYAFATDAIALTLVLGLAVRIQRRPRFEPDG